MYKNVIMMPIGVLEHNKLKHGQVLKITKMLMEICKRVNKDMNIKEYINEAISYSFIIKFSDIKEYFEYTLKKYIPYAEILDYKDNSNDSMYKRKETFVGSHIINIETFEYLNKFLWPEILQLYINTLKYENFDGNVEVYFSFDIDGINKMYGLDDFINLITEFSNDLSLYLTYNHIGKVNLLEKPYILNSRISIPVIIFI